MFITIKALIYNGLTGDHVRVNALKQLKRHKYSVSASQPRDRGYEPHTGHDHYSSYDTSTGWFSWKRARE